MAKLTKFRVYKGAKSGQRYDADMEVRVNTEGKFMITLPADLVDIALQKAKTKISPAYVEKGVTNYWVSSAQLKACELFITECVDEILSCTVEEQLVILYNYRANVVFANTEEDPDTIYPSGLGLKEYKWFGDRVISGAEMYDVGLTAMVRLKRTHTSPNSVHVEYVRPDRPNFSNELYLDKLNNFVGLRNLWQSRWDKDPKTLPYTEDAAKFFYEAMISLCKLGRNIDRFFGSPDLISNAIKNKSGTLLIGD
jgi:hypothetical protein